MPPSPSIDPLSTLVWTRASQHHLVHSGDTLAIISRWGRVWQAWAIAWFVLLATLALVLGFESGSGKVLTLSWLVSGLALAVALAVWLTPRFVGPIAPRVRFDRRRNLLTLNAPAEGLKGTLPLDQVAALQLIPAGPRPGDGSTFDTYQLNLILSGDPTPERQNLLHHGDPAVLREQGARIAGFLGRSFHDLA
jgi:hypothetical protein